jgi:hypothetical protein
MRLSLTFRPSTMARRRGPELWITRPHMVRGGWELQSEFFMVRSPSQPNRNKVLARHSGRAECQYRRQRQCASGDESQVGLGIGANDRGRVGLSVVVVTSTDFA